MTETNNTTLPTLTTEDVLTQRVAELETENKELRAVIKVLEDKNTDGTGENISVNKINLQTLINQNMEMKEDVGHLLALFGKIKMLFKGEIRQVPTLIANIMMNPKEYLHMAKKVFPLLIKYKFITDDEIKESEYTESAKQRRKTESSSGKK